MIAFDLLLGSGALLAPSQTLWVLGHDEPSDDARELFRRSGPVWLTFAAAHLVAYRRDRPKPWAPPGGPAPRTGGPSPGCGAPSSLRTSSGLAHRRSRDPEPAPGSGSRVS